MKEIVIKRARLEELSDLETMMYALHHEHYLLFPDHFKPAQEVMQDKNIAEYLTMPEGLVFVAYVDDLLVAFVTGHFGQLISLVSKNVTMGSIDELFVQPEYRGLGIAKQLIERCNREFEDYGVEQIFVEVWSGNRNAVSVYQQSGFGEHIQYLRKPTKHGKR